mmetsp:Transcript_29898/g.95790  ORF Transcript_29898/g.95790 Transcript_29898/m.95790 type:complete len:670 (+) Transcript_29898:1155-3164(+)
MEGEHSFRVTTTRSLFNPNIIRLQLIMIWHLLLLLGRSSPSSTSSASGIELGHDRIHHLLDLLLLLIEVFLLGRGVLVDPLGGGLDNLLEGLLILIAQLALDLVLIVDGVLDVVDVGLDRVLGIDALLHLLVLLLVLLGLLDHTVDLLLAQTALVVGDGDLLTLASSLVLGRHLEDAVGVDLEGHLDLGDTAGSRGKVGELELSEKMAILSHGTLTLKHLDQHSGLVVLGSGEGLGLLGGDNSVAANQLGQDASDSLDTEGEGGNVQKEKVGSLLATLAGEDTSLNGGTVSDSLIRVDSLVGLLAVEVVLEELLNLGDTGGSSDKNELVDLVLLQGSVIENLLDGSKGLLEEIHAELLELSAGDGLTKVGSLVEPFDLNTLLMSVGESTLGTLDFAAKLLHSLLVLGGILAGLLLEELENIVHYTTIEVLSSQVSITVGSNNLKDSVVDGKEGNIEGTTTKIEHEDVLLSTLVVKTVGNGSSGGLVDDTENVQTRDGTGILSGLPLGIVEVCRNGNDSVLDLLAEECLSSLLHLCENHGGNLLRRVSLLLSPELDLDVWLAPLVNDIVGKKLLVMLNSGIGILPADEALDVEDSVLRVQGSLVLGGISDQPLVVGEGNPRRGDTVTLIVGNDLNLAILVHTYARVGGSKIDTNGGIDLTLLSCSDAQAN